VDRSGRGQKVRSSSGRVKKREQLHEGAQQGNPGADKHVEEHGSLTWEKVVRLRVRPWTPLGPWLAQISKSTPFTGARVLHEHDINVTSHSTARGTMARVQKATAHHCAQG